MTLRKNISGADLNTPFIDGEVAAGAVVDTPDTQADGSLLIWDPAIWSEDTDDHPSARARKAAERAAREAAAAAQAVHADNAPNSDDGGNTDQPGDQPVDTHSEE